MPLTCKITAVQKIDEAAQRAMFTLFNRYFDNTDFGRFKADLAEKDLAIMQRTKDGGLAGFSTVQIFRTLLSGKECTFLYSGDTIVAPEFSSSSMLIGAFGHVMLRLIEKTEMPIYWLLISKGFRTYRLLPVFFNTFYPSYNGRKALNLKELRNRVGDYKFGKSYDPDKGIVSFNGLHDRLKESMCVVPEGRSHDPHVLYFLQNNPGYRQGDELLCLAEISTANMNRVAQRAIKGARVIWDE